MADRLVNVTLTANTAPYVAGMNSAAAATQRTAASTATMSAGMKRTSASMAQVAGGANLLRGGLTTPLVAAGAAVAGVAKASIDWESSWAGVTKTVDGSAVQMERLEGDLRGMARELPATHGEIAKVAEAAGQLGVRTDDVAAFSRVMVDLGETTNLTADQAATATARFANVMGTSQSEIENLGSALVDLGNNSETTEAEILMLSQRMAAAANIAGLSEADVLGFSAALTSVGVEAERGGTAMSKVFMSVRDSVIDADERLTVFAETAGMSADEFAAAFREDPALAIAAFIQGLGEMNAAGESTTAVFEGLELTDQRLMQALLATAEAGDLLVDSLEIGNEAWEENTALADEAANRYETTASSISTSMNRIKDRMIDVGDTIKPVVEELASGVADFLEIGSADLLSADGLQQIGDVMRDWGVPEQLLFTSEAAEDAAEWTGKFDQEMQGLISRVPVATEALESHRTITAELAEVTRTAAEMQAAYLEELAASTDPVVALMSALQDVDEAQEAYNESVDEYGKNSPEATAATRDLVEAVAAAEAAALNGDLSFDAFEAKLASWVEQGVLTKAEAKAIAGEVKDLRGEAEDYKGGYDARLTTSREARSRAEIQGLTKRAEHYARFYKATLTTGGTSKAAAEINGLLNRLAAFRGTHYATVNVGATGSGLGVLFGSRFSGHSGGTVTKAGIIPRMHEGGEVAALPRFHDGSSQLASDEVPAILQTGEVVLSRNQVGLLERALAPVAAPMGGAFHNGGTVGGGAVISATFVNRGVIGSQIEMENWLAQSVDNLNRKGRLAGSR